MHKPTSTRLLILVLIRIGAWNVLDLLQPERWPLNFRRKMSRDPPAFPGREQPAPVRAPFHAPRPPNWAAAPLLSSGAPRAAVGGGGCAAVSPRAVRWRAVEPAPRGDTKTEMFEGPNDTINTN